MSTEIKKTRNGPTLHEAYNGRAIADEFIREIKATEAPLTKGALELIYSCITGRLRPHLVFPSFVGVYKIKGGVFTFEGRYAGITPGEISGKINLDLTTDGAVFLSGNVFSPIDLTPGTRVNMKGTAPPGMLDNQQRPMSEGRHSLAKRNSFDYSANKETAAGVGQIPGGAAEVKDALAQGIKTASEIAAEAITAIEKGEGAVK